MKAKGKGKQIKSLRIQNAELISDHTFADIVDWAVQPEIAFAFVLIFLICQVITISNAMVLSSHICRAIIQSHLLLSK